MGEPRVVAVILDTGQIFAILSAYVTGAQDEITASSGLIEKWHTAESASADAETIA